MQQPKAVTWGRRLMIHTFYYFAVCWSFAFTGTARKISLSLLIPSADLDGTVYNELQPTVAVLSVSLSLFLLLLLLSSFIEEKALSITFFSSCLLLLSLFLLRSR